MTAWLISVTIAAVIVALAACAVVGMVITIHWLGGCDQLPPFEVGPGCADLGVCTRHLTGDREEVGRP